MLERIQVSVNLLTVTAVTMILACPWAGVCQAQQRSQAQQGSVLGSASPHEAGDYVGLTKCAACHFDQYKDWKGSEHNRAFEILPLKYRNDASCLECHTTGSMPPTPLRNSLASPANRVMVPVSEHSKFALRFVNEIITEEGLTTLRGKIQRLDMVQCVKCHVSKAHKKHPPFDREEVLPAPARSGSVSFFDSIHGRRSTNESALSDTLDDRVTPLPTEADPKLLPAEAETRLVRDDR